MCTYKGSVKARARVTQGSSYSRQYRGCLLMAHILYSLKVCHAIVNHIWVMVTRSIVLVCNMADTNDMSIALNLTRMSFK